MKKSLTQMFLEAEAQEASELRIQESCNSGTAKASIPEPQYLEGVWIVRPGAPIPEQFLDVLKAWDAFRNHPAWKGHPQL